MKIIIACEESQTVCKSFREKGHEAYSCDILSCSGGHPEWHIQDDVRNVLRHELSTVFNCKYDMVIAHPPCDYLTVSNNSAMNNGCSKYTKEQAQQLRADAIRFFEFFTLLKNFHVAIENPIGIMSSIYRKPDQIIQPYDFGDDASKKTCLWLKNLPVLLKTDYVQPRIVNGIKRWSNQTDSGQNKLTPSPTRQKERSKTYEGIAKAMANQWG